MKCRIRSRKLKLQPTWTCEFFSPQGSIEMHLASFWQQRWGLPSSQRAKEQCSQANQLQWASFLFQYCAIAFKTLKLGFQWTWPKSFKKQKWFGRKKCLNCYWTQQNQNTCRHLGQSYSHRGNGRGQGIEDLPLPTFIYYKRSFRKQAFRDFWSQLKSHIPDGRLC